MSDDNQELTWKAGDTWPPGEYSSGQADAWTASIDVPCDDPFKKFVWGSRIEMYGHTQQEAESLRDLVIAQHEEGEQLRMQIDRLAWLETALKKVSEYNGRLRSRLAELEGQEPTVEEIYSGFQEWCRNNPAYDLDPRLHTNSGRSIREGAYISHEKTRVAFAAYRAGIKRHPATPAVPEPKVISSPDLSLIIREVIRSNPVARGTLLSMKIAMAVSDALHKATPPAVPEWQPITSVPTDGQWIRGRTLTGTIIDKLRFTALGHWWWEPAGKEIYRPGVTPAAMLREAGIVEWMPMPAPQREGGAE